MHFNKGEIIVGNSRTKKTARHPIVFWEIYDDDSFLGLVLTHSDRGSNLRMEKEHFSLTDGSIRRYNKDRPTYVVPCKFVKSKSWGPYKQIGMLSEKGLIFIDEVIKNIQPMYWEDYIRSDQLTI